MRSIKEIVTSPRFMREISFLLFVFAAFSAVVGVVAITRDPMEPEMLTFGISNIVVAAINAILAFLIRRGLVFALWIAAALFVLDTSFQLLEPSGALVFRFMLIAILIRYIRRERVNA